MGGLFHVPGLGPDDPDVVDAVCATGTRYLKRDSKATGYPLMFGHLWATTLLVAASITPVTKSAAELER